MNPSLPLQHGRVCLASPLGNVLAHSLVALSQLATNNDNKERSFRRRGRAKEKRPTSYNRRALSVTRIFRHMPEEEAATKEWHGATQVGVVRSRGHKGEADPSTRGRGCAFVPP